MGNGGNGSNQHTKIANSEFSKLANQPKPTKAEPKEVASNHANMALGDNKGSHRPSKGFENSKPLTPKKLKFENSKFNFEPPKAEHKKTNSENSKFVLPPKAEPKK